jgi:D-sedoheptulose 7-phosphate isomerase
MTVEKLFIDPVEVKHKCIDQGFQSLVNMCDKAVKSIVDGNKIMLCGNGGSAANTKHLGAEMLVRLRPN